MNLGLQNLLGASLDDLFVKLTYDNGVPRLERIPETWAKYKIEPHTPANPQTSAHSGSGMFLSSAVAMTITFRTFY